MQVNLRSSRSQQIAAWAAAALFIAGFFVPAVGASTGPISGAWFVLTQKPRRGFLWQMAFSLIPALLMNSRTLFSRSPSDALTAVAWIAAGALIAVLPFTFHRLTSTRLPGLASTLPLPVAAVAIPWLAAMLHGSVSAQPTLSTLLLCWLAAALVRMWNLEAPASRTGGLLALTAAYGMVSRTAPFATLPAGAVLGWSTTAVAVALAGWALATRGQRTSWTSRPEAVAALRSPLTGSPLHAVRENGREALVSEAGERFPLRDGIPDFRRAEDLSGDNGKYNHLYETIGGFYDDIQRAFCGLKGWDREAYFRGYMKFVEATPGDRVLETSVGTGLNFKYLPIGTHLAGLDLSPEMLANCQAGLERRGLKADLYLGNAEFLPFADASFDVVFHVGGINFFNDRARAIREMIRVAKPGSRLLIADETEKHVKGVYEKGPGGHLYKNRKQAVSAPVDLVPVEMEEVHLEELRDGQFYVLTFRKPVGCQEKLTVVG